MVGIPPVGFKVEINEVQLTRILGTAVHVAAVVKTFNTTLRQAVEELKRYNDAQAEEFIEIRAADGATYQGPRDAVQQTLIGGNIPSLDGRRLGIIDPEVGEGKRRSEFVDDPEYLAWLKDGRPDLEAWRKSRQKPVIQPCGRPQGCDSISCGECA